MKNLGKILITAANNALAYELAWLLKNQQIELADLDHQKYKIPNSVSASFAHELLSFCLDNHIQTVFPLNFKEIEPLSKSKVLFGEFGINLMIPDLETSVKLHENNFKSPEKTQYFAVENLAGFSKAVLQAGYPKEKVVFGRYDHFGDLKIIDDKVSVNMFWENFEILDFLQCTSLFKRQPFARISIYPFTEKIKIFKFLSLDGIVFYNQLITDNELNSIKKLIKELRIDGFFEITFMGDLVVRCKPATV